VVVLVLVLSIVLTTAICVACKRSGMMTDSWMHSTHTLMMLG
jgi:hypothetical protein